MRHPLLNDDSKHYDTDDMPAIYYLEQGLTIIEAIGWCKGNIFKYEARLGKKATRDDFVNDFHKNRHLEDVKEKDLRKIETYRNYLDLLIRLRNIAWNEIMNKLSGYSSLKDKSVRFLIDRHMPGVEYKAKDDT